jgi:hypothetical protein
MFTVEMLAELEDHLLAMKTLITQALSSERKTGPKCSKVAVYEDRPVALRSSRPRGPDWDVLAADFHPDYRELLMKLPPSILRNLRHRILNTSLSRFYDLAEKSDHMEDLIEETIRKYRKNQHYTKNRYHSQKFSAKIPSGKYSRILSRLD